MTTEQAVKIGDLVIDEETGEILECPEGVTDRLEWLTHLAVEAKEQEKTWASAGGMYRQAIGKLLDQAGQKRMETAYGIAGWRSRLDVRAKPDNLAQVMEDHELGDGEMKAILGTAKELDAKRLMLLPETTGGRVPLAAVRALITEKESSWVQIDRVKKVAPEIERVSRKGA